ncbi:hypothetical protein IC229_09450 [Spirosoma sp. BT702]|uniref:Uncharacterized protein n=1 Tax=Spirosoma profusum TaxID=2771354 RepID=A0A926XZR8_9BACT|nr:hypothetical protein [Spirosoma profusum]MBD2700863.1 hypothetical protein [Spirosoma profusum]
MSFYDRSCPRLARESELWYYVCYVQCENGGHSHHNCYRETGGMAAFEAEGYTTRTNGMGAAANRSWTSLSVSNASGNTAMTINVQNNLVGPRLDYSLNFTTAGT